VLLLLADKRFTCSECSKELDRFSVFVCDATRDDTCSDCKFRFRCFSSSTVEGENA